MNESDHAGDKAASDLTNLSDVIRRHAEELARLSGRLAYDASQPPPGVAMPPPVQTPVFTPRGDKGANLPARAGDPSLAGDSLPVLTAFREFLEQERLRTRRRMMRVGYLTLAGAMILVAIGLLVGHWDVSQTRIKLEAARRASDAKLSKYGDRAVKVERALAREWQDLRAAAGATSNHLNRMIISEKKAMLVNQSAIVERLLEQTAELEKMREAITALEIEKASLAGNLSTMAAEIEEYKAAAAKSEVPPVETEESLVRESSTPAKLVSPTPATPPQTQPLVPFRLPEP